MFCSFRRVCLTAVCGLGLTFFAITSAKTGFSEERDDVIPPLDIFKTMASDLQPDGWITFQELDGKQIVSFAPVMALRCRLKEIRYSVDSKDLDQSFPIPECNREYPFQVVPDSIHQPYILEFDGGTVQALAVQLTWDDDSKSDVAYYEPCRDVDSTPCAYPLGSNL